MYGYGLNKKEAECGDSQNRQDNYTEESNTGKTETLVLGSVTCRFEYVGKNLPDFLKDESNAFITCHDSRVDEAFIIHQSQTGYLIMKIRLRNKQVNDTNTIET